MQSNNGKASQADAGNLCPSSQLGYMLIKMAETECFFTPKSELPHAKIAGFVIFSESKKCRVQQRTPRRRQAN
jgi:hypothetical protein